MSNAACFTYCTAIISSPCGIGQWFILNLRFYVTSHFIDPKISIVYRQRTLSYSFVLQIPKYGNEVISTTFARHLSHRLGLQQFRCYRLFITNKDWKDRLVLHATYLTLLFKLPFPLLHTFTLTNRHRWWDFTTRLLLSGIKLGT